MDKRLTIEQIETLIEAVHHYGELNQQIKTVEEMGELTQALSKYMTSKHLAVESIERELISHISEEISDVEIMLQQMQIIFRNHDQVNCFIELKLGRLRNQIERERKGEEP